MESQDRIIRVNSCNSCPFNGECKAWSELTRKQKAYLLLSNSVPHNMMLKNCPLEEA